MEVDAILVMSVWNLILSGGYRCRVEAVHVVYLLTQREELVPGLGFRLEICGVSINATLIRASLLAAVMSNRAHQSVGRLPCCIILQIFMQPNFLH